MSNPFEVLKLDPTASAEEIVRQAGRLRQRAPDEAAIAVIRQAVQALSGGSEERQLHEILTHPAPCYSWPALDQFVATFRRPPQADPASAVSCPPLDLAELSVFLRPLLDAELNPPPLGFETIGEPDSTGEIVRQSLEATWQLLPLDSESA
jgi:hypothetical protein